MKTVALAASLLAIATGCGEREVTVRYFRSETYTFSSADRAAIDRIANATAVEVREFLPRLPRQLELTVRPGTDVITEVGAAAAVMPPAAVMWTVDPAHAGGVVATAQKELRATLFHEFHHLVRSAAGIPRSVIDHAIHEGMATAFERDFAGRDRPWGNYGPEISALEEELLSLPSDAKFTDWVFSHADGRRWIGLRVGTAWVDRSTAKSGRTSADLVSTPVEEILSLAGVSK